MKMLYETHYLFKNKLKMLVFEKKTENGTHT